MVYGSLWFLNMFQVSKFGITAGQVVLITPTSQKWFPHSISCNDPAFTKGVDDGIAQETSDREAVSGKYEGRLRRKASTFGLLDSFPVELSPLTTNG